MRLPSLALLLMLAGCGGGALSMLTGGGPNVAANVQAAKTASQTIGKTEVQEQAIENVQAESIRQSADKAKVKADQVEQVIVYEYPPWLVLAFAVALFLDSPLRWAEQIVSAVRKATAR